MIKKITLTVSTFVVVGSLLYFSSILLRAYATFQKAITSDPILKGKMYEFSSSVGTQGVPNSVGTMTHHKGLITQVKLDAYGFRIPMAYSFNRTIKAPTLMTFGCSYTFGDNCDAEQTYPFLLEKKMNGTTFNAGQSGASFATMLLAGQKWIPVLKPQYCLVQYTDWLFERSEQPIADSLFGKVTSPYFAKSKNGLIYIHEPPFIPGSAKHDFTAYFPPKNLAPNFFSFFRKAAFMSILNDDIGVCAFNLKSWVGIEDRPAALEEAVRFVYSQFSKLCEETQSKMVIVVLKTPSKAMLALLQQSAPTAQIVLAQERMKKLVDHNPDKYFEEYMFWGGSPPEIIDYHPNPKAHKVIADDIFESIQRDRISNPL